MKKDMINVEAMKLVPATLFAPGGLEDLLKRIESEARALVPNCETATGRKEIASNAARIPRSKTYLDDLGKNLTADLKKQTKAVDVERKTMRDRLDALKVEVRAPLTRWETAEEARIATIRARIDDIKDMASERETGEGCNEKPYSAAQLAKRLAELQGTVIDYSFWEFMPEAAHEKDVSLSALSGLLFERKRYEKEQAELARLRDEATAREQADRDEKIKREAADKARREEARTSEVKLARADSDRREAQQRAYEAENEVKQAAKMERDRIEAARQEEVAGARRREADKAHREVVEGAIISALIDFDLKEELAGTVTVAIRLGQIPNVSIQY